MKLVYPAIFYPYEDGAYTVEFPDLPGCITEGDDLAEAMYMAQEAASGWLLVTLEDGEELPKASTISDIVTDDGFVNMIAMDLDEFALKYGKHSVKKTLTIPAFMNTFVEEHKLSCSKMLQDAINSAMKAQVQG